MMVLMFVSLVASWKWLVIRIDNFKPPLGKHEKCFRFARDLVDAVSKLFQDRLGIESLGPGLTPTAVSRHLIACEHLMHHPL